MSKLEIFYYCESLNESVDSDAPVMMEQDQLVEGCNKWLLDNGDFFGITNHDDVTLQFMKTNSDRVWMEIPDPELQGSFGKYTTLSDLGKLLSDESLDFAKLKEQLKFQSWEPKEGDPRILAITEDEVENLVDDSGLCVAADMVTVGDRGIGFMIREEPEFDGDSGWRFFSGLETEEYAQNEAHFHVYKLNFVANFEPDVVPHLDAEVGMAFERGPNREWIETDDIE